VGVLYIIDELLVELVVGHASYLLRRRVPFLVCLFRSIRRI
jgi:hypothetical protein